MRNTIEGVFFVLFSLAMILTAMGLGVLAFIIFAVHTLP